MNHLDVYDLLILTFLLFLPVLNHLFAFCVSSPNTRNSFLCISAHLTVLSLFNPVSNLTFSLLPITSSHPHASDSTNDFWRYKNIWLILTSTLTLERTIRWRGRSDVVSLPGAAVVQTRCVGPRPDLPQQPLESLPSRRALRSFRLDAETTIHGTEDCRCQLTAVPSRHVLTAQFDHLYSRQHANITYTRLHSAASSSELRTDGIPDHPHSQWQTGLLQSSTD